jgi:Ca2+-binding EF-hand superfamily protein
LRSAPSWHTQKLTVYLRELSGARPVDLFVHRHLISRLSPRLIAANMRRIRMDGKKLTTLIVLSAAVLFGTGSLVPGALAAQSALKTIDTDNDGTVDLNEAKTAAAALFDRLDKDHDGTLDRKELRGRVSAKEFAEADPDHDRTLTKDEYLALVEQRFKAADRDNDGTLDAKELKGIIRLLK